jgi:hypothetical protein
MHILGQLNFWHHTSRLQQHARQFHSSLAKMQSKFMEVVMPSGEILSHICTLGYRVVLYMAIWAAPQRYVKAPEHVHGVGHAAR